VERGSVWWEVKSYFQVVRLVDSLFVGLDGVVRFGWWAVDGYMGRRGFD